MTTASAWLLPRQAWVLARANLKSRYRHTWAGFVWVILSPLLLFGAQSLVFGAVLRIQVPNFTLFLLTGLLPWIFVTQSLEMTTGGFVNSSRLLRSFPMHPLVLLGATLADNGINFLAAFGLLLVPYLVQEPARLAGVPLAALASGALAVGVFAAGWFLATLHAFFRDTKFIVTFALSVAFFLTPVFYPAELVPERWRWITALNPAGYWIAPFRHALHAYDPGAFWASLAGSVAVSAGLLALAWAHWRWRRNDLYFNL